MTRVLIDARVGWGHGIGRVIANTVPHVMRSRPDWRFSVLVGPANIERATTAFGKIDNLDLRPCNIEPFSLREQTSLPALARGHDLTWFTNYWVPLAWATPFVTTVHDMLHLLPQLAPTSILNRTVARATFAKVRRQALAVMFDSRFSEREFRVMVGEPRHGITVPLGGDHLTFPVVPKQKRLLCVAAPKQHKNFAMLIEAWQNARPGSDWTLTIVAPNDSMRSTIDLDRIAASADNVNLRRGVSNNELAELFAASAVVLTPSLYEGFGLPLLEGLQADALCVSSTAGSMVEVAEGAFVLFVNGTDQAGWTSAIETACATIDRNDPALAGILSHNRRLSGRFRWNDTGDQVAAVLDRALATLHG